MLLNFATRLFGMAAVLAGLCQPTLAGNCLSKADGFELNSDIVHWSLAIHASSECLQGLRGVLGPHIDS